MSRFPGLREVIKTQGLFSALYTDRDSHDWTTPEGWGRQSPSYAIRESHETARDREAIAAYSPQTRLCNRLGLTVSAAHYPPGTSKWNPIEHRWFSEISKNLGGTPFGQLPEPPQAHSHNHPVRPGLRVEAPLDDKTYQKGVRITDAQMRELAISKDARLPKWNYTLGTA